ncbi:alpha/beta fold hydrolase [Prosthecomicrobium sp. N25]|uniref:alpha/beta fold hydrolase n=1 Tax=Prosthecomicrobium sp. N25 TaxID=3129254 RepID=UPI003076B0CE
MIEGLSVTSIRTPAGDRFPVAASGDKGVPVLFLHGALGDLRTFAPHVARLGPERRSLAVTQRWCGTGRWRADGPAFGVGTHAADLVALAEGLGAGPLRVVAWSYAGHVALEAALGRPDLFAGLFLYEPGVRTIPLEPADQDSFAADAGTVFGPIVGAIGAGDLERAVRLLIDSSGGDGCFDALPSGRRAVYLENAHTLPRLVGQEPPPPISPEALRGLRVPTRVHWGSRSRPFSRLPAVAVAALVGDAGSGPVEAGHLWPEDDPDGFCEAVRTWADGLA